MGQSGAKLAKKFIIHGRVQGVGFRYYAERVANQLGLTGYVKNCWDGSVEACAVGTPPLLDEFKRCLARGPRGARVQRIEEYDVEPEERYARFVIEGGW